jgi:hypothetical protein
MKYSLLSKTVGWYGASAILLAYVLTNLSVLHPNSLYYQLLNFTGAAALMYVAWQKKLYSVAVLNVIWMVVAMVSLTNL